MPTIEERTIDSPLGPIRLLATQDALVEVRLPESRPRSRAPAGLPPEGPSLPAGTTDGAGAGWVLGRAEAELAEYFSGSRQRFELPISMAGTEFQRAVWRALLDIPYGEPRSYAWVARQIRRPTACRAVGAANGCNPLAIVIPCHRVIGADGSLTGYGGGLEAKRWLLEHEGVLEAALIPD